VPDKQRKKPYRLSATRQRNRRELEEYESRVFNLTLDINALRQQVQHLLERRDLQLTQSFVHRQRIEGEVLSVVARLLGDLNGCGPSVTAFELRCFFSPQLSDVSGAACGVLGRGTHVFSHRSWTTTSIRVTSFVEEDEDEGQAAPDVAETRRLCGDSNGCVVEALGVFTGRIKRELLATFYSHVLLDEALAARFVGLRITCPIRITFYFDAQRRITHQAAQIHLVAAMEALRTAGPADFARLMGASQ
jgi:hypothetical protein